MELAQFPAEPWILCSNIRWFGCPKVRLQSWVGRKWETKKELSSSVHKIKRNLLSRLWRRKKREMAETGAEQCDKKDGTSRKKCWGRTGASDNKFKKLPCSSESVIQNALCIWPLLLSHFSRVRLCATPETAAHQSPHSLGFSRQEHWSELPFPSPMHESEKWKWRRSVISDFYRPPGLQPTRLLRPWDFPGKSTGVGCHCLLRIWPLGMCKEKIVWCCL